MNINEIYILIEELNQKGYNPNTVLVQTDQNGIVIQQRGPKLPSIHINQLKEYLEK